MIESRAKLDKEYYEALAANKAKRRELWLEQKRIESLLPLDCETLSKIVADFDSLKAQALELHTQYESDIRTLKTEFHYERRLLVIDEDYTISHIREKYARFRKNIIKEGYTEEEGGKDE